MNAGNPVETGLAARLREWTESIHREAERSGVVSEILHGRASRSAYALYLRNLLPAYEALEQALGAHASPVVRRVAQPALYRTPAIKSDLTNLCGAGWAETLPLLLSAGRYASRVTESVAGDGSRLLAHAYTRHMADLSGGLILRKLLRRTLGLRPHEMAYYEFPDIPDPTTFKAAYRAALDEAGRTIAEPRLVLDEAVEAFRHNIDVSRETLAASETSTELPRGMKRMHA